jgi:uncharacterized protein
MITTILAGAGVGLASSFHCVAMCGPLAVASCSRRTSVVSYSLARIAAYTVVGAVVGAIAAPLTGSHQVPIRIAAAALAAFVLVRAAMKLLRPAPALVKLRKKSRLHPALLGAATSLFPCGALLSGWIVASTSGSAIAGALTMMAFALASTPALAATILGATSLAARFAHARKLAAIALLAVAGVTAFQATTFLTPHKHSCCPK